MAAAHEGRAGLGADLPVSGAGFSVSGAGSARFDAQASLLGGGAVLLARNLSSTKQPPDHTPPLTSDLTHPLLLDTEADIQRKPTRGAPAAAARRGRRLKGGGGKQAITQIEWANPLIGSFDNFGSATLLLYVMSTADG